MSLRNFEETSPGIYQRRGFSAEQMSRLTMRPDGLIAAALKKSAQPSLSVSSNQDGTGGAAWPK